jgi:hypothetical protein
MFNLIVYMKKKENAAGKSQVLQHCRLLLVALLWLWLPAGAQVPDKAIIQGIQNEANNNSQLEMLAHELLDVIGPRLTGTPQMQRAGDWVREMYQRWNITARQENWGEWQAWERGITHIDLVSPRVRTLEGMQLAWSPGTKGKTVNGEVVILPDLADSLAYVKWLPQVKGKFVLLSMLQPTGRPDYNWEEFGTQVSQEKMTAAQKAALKNWNGRIAKTGHTAKTLPEVLEQAGAAGVITSQWSGGLGTSRIFAAYTKQVPTLGLSLEDYGLLYRLAASGHTPRINVLAVSASTGKAPAFNTVAEIRGTEKPEEYIVLSAHLDSWDGSSGATDNGTGTLVMMEAMRILKKIYPNPKRTIIAGHWGAEEHGILGSKAFVEDHPDIIKNMQAGFNQDNGTGRVKTITGQGFADAYDYLGRWLAAVPKDITDSITTTFPGIPARGSSDHSSFVSAGAPAFYLSSLSWLYSPYTWHTNRDTYDKIVFDDVRNNAILTAILTYMASEDPERTSRVKRLMPVDPKTGVREAWPERRSPLRKGRLE